MIRPAPEVNCTPFVRQYGILLTSGVLFYAERNTKQEIYRRIQARSRRSVWWVCNTCGYEWKAKVKDRNNGNGCPNCNRINRTLPRGRIKESGGDVQPVDIIGKHQLEIGQVENRAAQNVPNFVQEQKTHAQ